MILNYGGLIRELNACLNNVAFQPVQFESTSDNQSCTITSAVAPSDLLTPGRGTSASACKRIHGATCANITKPLLERSRKRNGPYHTVGPKFSNPLCESHEDLGNMHWMKANAAAVSEFFGAHDNSFSRRSSVKINIKGPSDVQYQPPSNTGTECLTVQAPFAEDFARIL